MLAKKYQTQSSAIATYDYTDIAEGTGISAFYGGNASGSTAWILTGNTSLYSATGFTVLNGFDQNFDVPFNMPKSIKGELLLQVPISLYADPTYSSTGYIVAKVVHYDGTTETIIGGPVTSPSKTNGGSGAWGGAMLVLKMTIARKHFKKGDILRLNIVGTQSGTGTDQGVIGHSPIGTQSTSSGEGFAGLGTSRISMFVPFELDL